MLRLYVCISVTAIASFPHKNKLCFFHRDDTGFRYGDILWKINSYNIYNSVFMHLRERDDDMCHGHLMFCIGIILSQVHKDENIQLESTTT